MAIPPCDPVRELPCSVIPSANAEPTEDSFSLGVFAEYPVDCPVLGVHAEHPYPVLNVPTDLKDLT